MLDNAQIHDNAQRNAITDAFQRFEGKTRQELLEWQGVSRERFRLNGSTHQNMADCRVLFYLLNPATEKDPRAER